MKMRTPRVEKPQSLYDVTRNLIHDLETIQLRPTIGQDLVNQALLALVVIVERQHEKIRSLEEHVADLAASDRGPRVGG